MQPKKRKNRGKATKPAVTKKLVEPAPSESVGDEVIAGLKELLGKQSLLIVQFAEELAQIRRELLAIKGRNVHIPSPAPFREAPPGVVPLSPTSPRLVPYWRVPDAGGDGIPVRPSPRVYFTIHGPSLKVGE